MTHHLLWGLRSTNSCHSFSSEGQLIWFNSQGASDSYWHKLFAGLKALALVYYFSGDTTHASGWFLHHILVHFLFKWSFDEFQQSAIFFDVWLQRAKIMKKYHSFTLIRIYFVLQIMENLVRFWPRNMFDFIKHSWPWLTKVDQN